MASKKTLTTAVEVDTDKAQRNLSKLGDAAKDAGKDLERAGEDFDKLGRDATDAGRDLDRAGDDADKLGRDAKDAAVDVDRLADELRNSGDQAKAMGRDTADASDDIRASYETIENGAVGTASSVGEAFGEGGDIQSGLGSAAEAVESFAELFGPAGLIVSFIGGAAIGAITKFFDTAKENTEELKEKTLEYFDAFVEGVGQVQEEQKNLNYKEWIEENDDLAQSVSDLAGSRGLGLLRDAVNGSEDAYSELQQVLDEQQDANKDELTDLYLLARSTDGLTDAQKARQRELNEANRNGRKVLEALENESGAVQDARRQWQLYTDGVTAANTARERARTAGIGTEGVRGGTQQYRNYAAGGPVSQGVPVTVGEYGKEMFVPSTDGTIIPQHDLRRGVGGGGTVVVNVTTSDPDRMAAHTVRALRRARFRQGL